MMSRQLPQVIQNILFIKNEWPTQATLSHRHFETYSDERLLSLLQGDASHDQREDAFNAIYNKYYLDIVKICRSKDIEEDGVRDIFTQVWVVFLNKIPSFKWDENSKAGSRKSLKPFLLSTNSILCKEYTRKRLNTSEVKLDIVIDYIDSKLRFENFPLTHTTSSELQDKADEAFERYLSLLKSDRDRELLRQFYYFENQNSREIADILGMRSAGAVRTAHFRALKKLRKAVQKAKNNE